VPFDIVVHESDAIIEIVYPENPTKEDVKDYADRVKKIIAKQTGPWSCLVDQRRLHLMPDPLYEQVAALNVFAQQHGMKQSARVVSGPVAAVATLQTKRMHRQAALSRPVRTFTSRDEALGWLRR
jgi:hypothetical protein